MESRFSSQDASNFDRFFRDDYRRIVGFVSAMNRGRIDDAEDVAQEAMIELCKKIEKDSWESIESPSALVRTIARRIFFKRITKWSENPNGPLDEGVEIKDWIRHDPILESLDAAQFIALIGTLPLAQREVMAWTFDGFEPSEIASVTGRQAQTVRSNLRHARRAIEKLLKTPEGRTDKKGGVG